MKVEGEIGNLIALQGVTERGEITPPVAMNLQDEGYWAVVVPFYPQLSSLRLVTATEQDEFERRF